MPGVGAGVGCGVVTGVGAGVITGVGVTAGSLCSGVGLGEGVGTGVGLGTFPSQGKAYDGWYKQLLCYSANLQLSVSPNAFPWEGKVDRQRRDG